MKPLQTKFVKNCDNRGDTTFVQLRRQGNVCLYRRFSMDGKPLECEVFAVKTILAGASLPGGGTVAETYESYPGKAVFGKSAWACCGLNCEERANQRFDELVKGKIKPIIEAEIEPEETGSVRVIRVRAPVVKKELKLPEGKFTQKQLGALNGFLGDDCKNIYLDLKRLLSEGILKVVGEQASKSRGRPQKVFCKA
jgi:hypothetical protein